MEKRGVLAVGTFVFVLGSFLVAVVVSNAGDLIATWEIAAYGIWLLAFAAVGLLIVFRRPGNAIAWLCLGFATVWAVYFALDAILRYEMANPGSVSRPEILAVVANQLWVPGVGLICYLLLLFPEGALPSPRWKWFSRLILATMALLIAYGLLIPGPFVDWDFENPLGVSWVTDYVAIDYALVITLVLSVLASAVSVVFRYRRADTTERFQLKWLLAAGVITAVSYALVFIEDGAPFILAWSTIPVAIGFAVLRYRLYDIDRLISRTLSYAVVAGLLAAIFYGAVLLLSLLVPTQSNLAVAGSTLIAAVTFNPLRRRVQDWIGRRFDRSQFDSRMVIEQFADRLRDQTDFGELEVGLTDVVSRTLRPNAISLWVRARG